MIEFLTKYSITHLSLCCRNSSQWNPFSSSIAGLRKSFFLLCIYFSLNFFPQSFRAHVASLACTCFHSRQASLENKWTPEQSSNIQWGSDASKTHPIFAQWIKVTEAWRKEKITEEETGSDLQINKSWGGKCSTYIYDKIVGLNWKKSSFSSNLALPKWESNAKMDVSSSFSLWEHCGGGYIIQSICPLFIFCSSAGLILSNF